MHLRPVQWLAVLWRVLSSWYTAAGIGLQGAYQAREEWWKYTLRAQYPLEGAPDTWLVTGGRGSGKTSRRMDDRPCARPGAVHQ